MSRPKPLQNRVLPSGEIVATPARGEFMGNRGGRLHNTHMALNKARWRSKSWIICVLAFKGRSRKVMQSGYTELFFLDEATALAAGHRPCFECRRQDAIAYAQAWNRHFDRPGRAQAAEMDSDLHKCRTGAPVYMQPSELPPGTMIEREDAFFLICADGVQKWSHSGYGLLQPPPCVPVRVLTPQPTIEVLRNGYLPKLHATTRLF